MCVGMAEDPELLRQCVETSSQEAFGKLVGRCTSIFVYGVALRYSGNAQWAEDATQVVFINLARKARALCQRNQLAGYGCTSPPGMPRPTLYVANFVDRSTSRGG